MFEGAMTLTRLIDATTVPDGEGRAVPVSAELTVAVFNIEGEFFATQDQCTHGKASLCEGWTEGFEVVCPVHEGRFDLRNGAPLCFPVTDPLRTFPCQVRDGAVWAEIPRADN
jgi:naphthalene 1,2-dioxygenase system ferredoxin subunit